MLIFNIKKQDFFLRFLNSRKAHLTNFETAAKLVQLYHNGKRKCDICREYDIASSLLDKRLK